jgi:hypothetical protein
MARPMMDSSTAITRKVGTSYIARPERMKEAREWDAAERFIPLLFLS